MNKLNKIVLSCIIGISLHQSYAHEGNTDSAAQEPVKTNSTPTTAPTAAVQKDKDATPSENSAPAEDHTKKLQELKKERDDLQKEYKNISSSKNELISQYKKDGKTEKEWTLDPAMVELVKKEENTSAKIKEKEDAINRVWKLAYPKYAAISDTCKKYIFGGLIISYLGATGNTAKAIRFGSGAVVIAAAGACLYKGYQYLFEEEVDEDETM